MSNPFLKFFPSDWRSDPRLKMCGAAARGIWIEMICLMHEATPYGHLLIHGQTPNEAQLASLTGIPAAELSEGISELERMGVYSRTKEGVLYSRKLVRMEAKSVKARRNGKKGGNPSICNKGEKKESVNLKHNPQDKPQKPETRSQSKEEIPNGISKKKRGCRLPETWVLPEAGHEYALKQGLSNQAIDIEEQKFKNYWIAKTGAGATKLDWPATWRSWILNNRDRYGNGPPRGRTSGSDDWPHPDDHSLPAATKRIMKRQQEKNNGTGSADRNFANVELLPSVTQS